MILPSLFSNGLSNTGGTNDGSSPNIYFYQSNGTSSSPPVSTPSGWKQINYTKDSGANDFFKYVFSSDQDCGGSIGWINGIL
jgi:hypothetical protein